MDNNNTKSSKTSLNEHIIKEKNTPKNVTTKKVVKICEDTPTFLEADLDDEARITTRKPRPKSAEVRSRSKSLPRRPLSAQVKIKGHHEGRPKVTKNQQRSRDASEERKDLISSFNRSLRLLGLHVEELTKNTAPYRPARHTGPSFRTRLSSRAVSLENISAVTLADRRALADVVYQEWYFTKLQQERDKRDKLIEERDLAQANLEKRKTELAARSQENFLQWKCRKDREAADVKEIQRQRQLELEKLRSDAAKIQKALADWNNHKVVQLRKEAKAKREKELKEAEKKLKDETEKQQHAREAYTHWKKKTAELMQRRSAKEEKSREAAEKKRQQMLERRVEAQESFCVWKLNKDKYFKTKIRQMRNANAETSRDRVRRVAERMYEAEQAYQDWLDSVESRSNASRSNTVSPMLVRHWNC